MYNIKRNKKIIDYLTKQLKRLKIETDLTLFFGDYILLALKVSDTIEVAPKVATIIEPDILDNDGVLIEMLKLIGIMEVSKDKKEFEKLNERREKVRNKEDKQDLTDFDKILDGIMKVPIPDDKKKKKKTTK